MTNYILSIKNKSGTAQTFALYQDFLSNQGNSVIWISKFIANNNTHYFSWDIKWGLGWSTIESPLKTGIQFKSKGPIQAVIPIPGMINGIKIGYLLSKTNHNDGDFTQKYIKSQNIMNGELIVETTNDFSIGNAKHMFITVYNEDKPVLMLPGHPNSHYIINVHSTYCLTITEMKQSEMITGSISSSTQIELSDNIVHSLGCILDDHLIIIC